MLVYLTIDFSEKNRIVFTMYHYIKNIVGTAPLDMNGTANDSAKAGLFTVDESSPLLNEKAADFFHSIIARLSFTARRARPDIQVDVAYFCTIVRAPTVSEYKRLTRVVRYLRAMV